MAIEMLVGLNVIDRKAYQTYRDAMTPILKRHGGAFGYDFEVAEVLQSETAAPINRLFTIYFSSEDQMNTFFTNDTYLAIKHRYFENAVGDTTIIATYPREDIPRS